MKIEFSTHPNPAFERKDWLSLNGSWDFAFDYENAYEFAKQDIKFDRKITVPFCYQSALSGIDGHEVCDNIWYRTFIDVTSAQLNGSVLIHFGAVDNTAKLFVNGQAAGTHTNGYASFYFDITAYLKAGKNEIILKAEDTLSGEICRGKQSTFKENHLCWYENVVGIWQNVWLEFTAKKRITKVHCTPDNDNNLLMLDIELNGKYPKCQVEIEIKSKDKVLCVLSAGGTGDKITACYRFSEAGARAPIDLYWSPWNPNLIDVKVVLKEKNNILDTVYTYTGMRKISVSRGRIYLNDEPLYQRLVLDQGYFKDSLLTPPDDTALMRDIELTKLLGFNGARKHQKIEDPRYYYFADKLGLLVWGELPSPYDFSEMSRRSMTETMTEFIRRDYNHPCIINWVTVNESWGLHRITGNDEQKHFARALYYLVKSMDKTRLVTSNDGWEQLEETDICGIHDYDATVQDAVKKYGDLNFLLDTNAQFKALYAEGSKYNGKPVIVTEYGGVKISGGEGWGYQGDADTPDKLLEIIDKVTKGVTSNRNIVGYCYTQFTDVYQEKNGLVDMDRKLKIPAEKLKKIFGSNPAL